MLQGGWASANSKAFERLALSRCYMARISVSVRPTLTKARRRWDRRSGVSGAPVVLSAPRCGLIRTGRHLADAGRRELSREGQVKALVAIRGRRRATQHATLKTGAGFLEPDKFVRRYTQWAQGSWPFLSRGAAECLRGVHGLGAVLHQPNTNEDFHAFEPTLPSLAEVCAALKNDETWKSSHFKSGEESRG